MEENNDNQGLTMEIHETVHVAIVENIFNLL